MTDQTEAGTALERPAEIVDPLTGELVRWYDAAQVAATLRALRDHKGKVLDAIKLFEAALIDESERRGTKTLHLDGDVGRAVVSGGDKVEWDVEVLEELTAAGLPADRFAELVAIEQTYKVDARVAKQLEAANPRYAEIIGRARTRVPGRTYVKV